MNSNRKSEIESNLLVVEKEIDNISESINKNKEISKISALNIKELEEQKANLAFVLQAYGSLQSTTIDDMDEHDYHRIYSILNEASRFSSLYNNIFNETSIISELYGEQQTHILGATPVTCLFSSSTTLMISDYPMYFPNAKKLTEKHRPDVQINRNITYIKSQLEMIDTTLVADFNHFVNVFYSSDNLQSSYIELIGGRSLFFFKMIPNDYSSITEKPTNRQRIIGFVYGDSNQVKGIDESINFAVKLYNEISNQDPTGQSVKLGNVSDSEIKQMFIRIIHIVTSLLKVRENMKKR